MQYNINEQDFIVEGVIDILDKYLKKFLDLISINDNPIKLTKSISLGFFLAFLPLPGFNLPIGIILAKLLRLNIVATSIPALLLTYVSPFIYVFNYKTGKIFIATSEKPPETFPVDLTFWEKTIDFFMQAGPAYLLGSVINALLAALISYLCFHAIYKNIDRIASKKKNETIEVLES